MDISIVIPLLNEEESIKELFDWISLVMSKQSLNYEVIFIDDGSTDGSWNIIQNLSENHTEVKAIRFLCNFGKSQALHAGFEMAKGKVVITMDADLQDSPDEILDLYNLIHNQDFDMISGWKKKRYDSVLSKNIPSKLFNWAARKTSGLQLNDFNCGLKAYKNQVVKSIEVSGEMHRYIPVLVKNAGYKKIGQKEVKHQARKYGETKFGASRFLNGFLDLITIWFLSKFGKRPMHLFGAMGVMMFLIGFTSAGLIGGFKIYRLVNDLPYSLITENPWFYISLTTMIIGTQLFLAGFLAEIILRNKNNTSAYKIVDRINFP